MAQNVDISHVDEFDGSYYYIWKHIFKLIFMTENLVTMVNGSEIKPVAPPAAQIAAETPSLHVTGTGCIGDWEQRITLSLTIMNNCLDNSIVSHVQPLLQLGMNQNGCLNRRTLSLRCV